MSAHSSLVGGSTAGRLLACPGSFQATQALPPSADVASQYAEEGTFAHEVMTTLMLKRFDNPAISNLRAYAIDRLGMTFYDRVFTREHYDDMIEPALTQLELLEAEYETTKFKVLGVEQRVKFPNIPGAFGTCDLILGNSKWILHVDWKFGQGVPVKAEYEVEGGIVANAQLMFYAAAAMHTKPKLYKGARGPALAIAIIQPRTDVPLSHTAISRKEVAWFVEDLEAAVIKAIDRDPERHRGEHCRWAPCKVNCPLWTGPILELAALEDIKRDELVSREITDYAKFLAHAKTLVDIAAMYKKEIDEQLHAYLEDGGTVPGWRLKKKAKQRQWIDEDTVVKELCNQGLELADIYQTKLGTFAQVEAAARRLGVTIPDNLRVAPPTNETTVCPADDPAPVVDRQLAIEQFRASIEALNAAAIAPPPSGLASKTESNTNMNDITKTDGNSLELSDEFVQQLMTGVASSPLQATGAGGTPLLRMEKSGAWVWGMGSDEVQHGSHWLVNPMSFMHGWVLWAEQVAGAKNRKLGEVMGSMSRAAPACPEPVNGKSFTPQGSFELKCMDGTDEGVQVLFKSPSQGGVQAIGALVEAFQRHYAQKDGKLTPCPIITLGNSWYTHPTFGKIYKPVFEVTGWADMNGAIPGAAPAPPAEPQAAPPKPARARKPSLVPDPAPASREAPAPEPAPVSTQQAHAGQRRRPAR